eukprot:TRINITY_DN1700_c0_g1_i1.p1 TRINITY_DN1700_c0_g1~~TRINITY_DN1700_c0_g1_i1.p1  ORF type:complete len:478 (-),score=116.36 TRINITY_DN1700_c0_g1_i1:29-1435(-)
MRNIFYFVLFFAFFAFIVKCTDEEIFRKLALMQGDSFDQKRFAMFQERAEKFRNMHGKDVKIPEILYRYEHELFGHGSSTSIDKKAKLELIRQYRSKFIEFGLFNCKTENLRTFQTIDVDETTEIAKNFSWLKEGQLEEVPIHDQSKCGSCWVHAALGVYSYNLQRHTGVVSTYETVDFTNYLREQAKKANEDVSQVTICDGGLSQEIYSFMLQENDYFHAPMYDKEGNEMKDVKVQPGCWGYINSNPLDSYLFESASSISHMKRALVQYGPMVVSVKASELMYYHPTTGNEVLYTSSNDVGDTDHAVIVVGYGRENTTKGETDYWIVQNSWGTSYGLNGFVKIATSEDAAGALGIRGGGLVPIFDRSKCHDYPAILQGCRGIYTRKFRQSIDGKDLSLSNFPFAEKGWDSPLQRPIIFVPLLFFILFGSILSWAFYNVAKRNKDNKETVTLNPILKINEDAEDQPFV